MSDPFIGEIQIYAFNFAPYNWAMCQGQLMPIQQNTALFSLLGVTFGGNGTSNYQLPNYVGNAACGQGAGPGLTPRVMGETFGSDSVTLLTNEMPAHNHNAFGTSAAATQPVPANAMLATAANVYAAPTNTTTLQASTIGNAGTSAPHNNMQPYLTINFCIALTGIFPSRN